MRSSAREECHSHSVSTLQSRSECQRRLTHTRRKGPSLRWALLLFHPLWPVLSPVPLYRMWAPEAGCSVASSRIIEAIFGYSVVLSALFGLIQQDHPRGNNVPNCFSDILTSASLFLQCQTPLQPVCLIALITASRNCISISQQWNGLAGERPPMLFRVSISDSPSSIFPLLMWRKQRSLSLVERDPCLLLPEGKSNGAGQGATSRKAATLRWCTHTQQIPQPVAWSLATTMRSRWVCLPFLRTA